MNRAGPMLFRDVAAPGRRAYLQRMIGPDVANLEVDGRRIAYRLREGAAPAIVFLPGYASDMEGAKATALDEFAAERGLAMLRFDYSGTGSSAGSFEQGTLDRWLEEALAIVDRLTEGPVVLVGSSMGGWLALHVALRRPERIVGLVGIAAAPDFTEWGYSDEHRAELQRADRLERPNPYGEPQVTTRAFWESGQQLCLLDLPIEIGCPVRLIHGDADEDVPLEVALRLLHQLRSSDAQLLILKGGGHRLSEPRDLAAFRRTAASLLEPSS